MGPVPALAKPVHPLRMAIAHWDRVWKERFGFPYEYQGQDFKHLGKLVKGARPGTLDTLPEAFGRYLDDTSPKVEDWGHSLAAFCWSGGVNKYRASRPVHSEQEARTDAAGRRFMEMTNGHRR